MMTLDNYIKELLSKGKGYFTTQEAVEALEITNTALRLRIHRLKNQGEIVSPARNLFVAVAPEYRSLGCIPAAELAIILMKFWKQKYYAGLLTAALYHGASHQKPQIFQIIVDKQIAPIVIGKVALEFVFKKSLDGLQTQPIEAKSGYLQISSPEVTAMDLIVYSHRVGGINAIATVLSELVDVMNPGKLVLLAQTLKGKVWVQRLGWILEQIDTVDNEKRDTLLTALQGYLGNHRLFYTPVTPELETVGCSRNEKWMIIENTSVESDYDT